MFYRAFWIFLGLTAIVCCTAGEASLKKNEKRLGTRGSYQMCLESFDVHRDKIIRTQDSRDMGAKYLNEIEVESRDECIKYCCDTERCDVFVFEEKKPGSCYLFQCGPLHDFKCKFTTHANYSSAVRTTYNTQSSAQLEEEILISQQEHELKSLRKLADSAPAEYSFTEPTAKLIATVAQRLTLTTPVPVKPACTRNQYECRSSGDCIAIYNVCDGIPQCADGSDEAADLICPTEKPTVPTSLVMQGPPPGQPLSADTMKYQQMVEQRKSLVPLYARAPETNLKLYDIPNIPHQVMPQEQRLMYPAQPVDIPQMHKGFAGPGYPWNYQPLYEQNKDPYSPVNSFHEPSNINSYEPAEQPHIFNHKGPSVIGEKESDSGTYSEPKHVFASHFPSSNRGTWQEPQPPPSSSAVPSVQHKQVQVHEVEKSVVSTTVPPCDKNVATNSNEVSKSSQKTEKHVFHEKAANKDSGKSNATKSNASKFSHAQMKEPKERKSLILIEDHAREHGRGNVIAEHLKQANDNEVLRPRGAVISLALGLTITAITATLIACRLRVVRRRGRRGHGSYAHDADYLVNGMYL